MFFKNLPANRKSQIRNFLGSFPYRKSATFLGVPVRKSQSANFHDQSANCITAISIKYSRILSQTVRKTVFLKLHFYCLQI